MLIPNVKFDKARENVYEIANTMVDDMVHVTSASDKVVVRMKLSALPTGVETIAKVVNIYWANEKLVKPLELMIPFCKIEQKTKTIFGDFLDNLTALGKRAGYEEFKTFTRKRDNTYFVNVSLNGDKSDRQFDGDLRHELKRMVAEALGEFISDLEEFVYMDKPAVITEVSVIKDDEKVFNIGVEFAKNGARLIEGFCERDHFNQIIYYEVISRIKKDLFKYNTKNKDEHGLIEFKASFLGITFKLLKYLGMLQSSDVELLENAKYGFFKSTKHSITRVDDKKVVYVKDEDSNSIVVVHGNLSAKRVLKIVNEMQEKDKLLSVGSFMVGLKLKK